MVINKPCRYLKIQYQVLRFEWEDGNYSAVSTCVLTLNPLLTAESEEP